MPLIILCCDMFYIMETYNLAEKALFVNLSSAHESFAFFTL